MYCYYVDPLPSIFQHLCIFQQAADSSEEKSESSKEDMLSQVDSTHSSSVSAVVEENCMDEESPEVVPDADAKDLSCEVFSKVWYSNWESLLAISMPLILTH